MKQNTTQEDLMTPTPEQIKQAIAELKAQTKALEDRISNLLLNELKEFEASTGYRPDSVDVQIYTRSLMGRNATGNEIVISKYYNVATDASLDI
jgi:hypothetical protein